MKEPRNLNEELVKYMKMIAKQNTARQVILRGLMTGMFVALGTLIGLAIILIGGTALLSNQDQIPLLDAILEQTKLDVLIENQINDITNQNNSDSDSSANNDEGGTEQTLTFQSEDLGISFQYPSSLETQITKEGITSEGRILQWTSSGLLNGLELYVADTPSVVGNSSERLISLADETRVNMDIYTEGVLVQETQYSNEVFVVEVINSSGITLTFVGISGPDLPKTAREIFTAILGSLDIS